MSSFSYEIVKHARGELLYVIHEKQFYYKHGYRSFGTIYRCKVKKCNCRVVLNGGKCSRSSSATQHDHGNSEVHYKKLKTFNEVTKTAVELSATGVKKTAREIFEKATNNTGSNANFDAIKRSVRRRLAISNKCATNAQNAIVLPQTSTTPSTSSTVLTNAKQVTTSAASLSDIQLTTKTVIKLENIAPDVDLPTTSSCSGNGEKLIILKNILIKPKNTVNDQNNSIQLSPTPEKDFDEDSGTDSSNQPADTGILVTSASHFDPLNTNFVQISNPSMTKQE